MEVKFEASRGGLIKFKKRSHFYNIEVQAKAARADIQAAASYPENLAKIINKVGYGNSKLDFQCR